MILKADQLNMRSNGSLLALVCVLALLASACGGGGDGSPASELADQAASADSSNGNTSSAGATSTESETAQPAATGPIAGPLWTTGSFGLGLFTVDLDTGQIRELETDLVDGLLDRNDSPAATPDAVYVLGGSLREGTDFSSDVKLLRIDRATGEFSVLADLGFDRESDDATDNNSFDLQGAGGDSVFVTVRASSTNETTWHHIDATTGAEIAQFPEPSYEFADDSGTCSSTVQPKVSVDGRLVAFIDEFPGEIDATTGVITELPGGRQCGDPATGLSEVATPDELDAFSTYLDGVPVEWSELDPFFWPDVSGGFAVGDGFVIDDSGSYWWVFQGSQSTSSFEELTPADALVMGVVQYDPDSATVVNVFPMGDYAGEHLEVTDDNPFSVTTPQFDLAWVDGRLAMVDIREDAPTLILDPATGSITETVYDLGAGIDFVEANLLATVPGELWVTVRRGVIVNDDDTGRTSTSSAFVERIDPATGAVIDSFTQAVDS